MRKEEILVVEDDIDINNLIKKTLEKSGYSVTQAFSGSEALLRLDINEFDIILLDLMLPGLCGEELIKNIRTKKELPIIVISAKSSLEDKVNVLNIGADDYITKPFQYEEIIARVNSQLRRYKKSLVQEEEKEDTVFKFRDLILKVESREVIVKDKNIDLTGHEFEILTILVESPDKVFSREILYEKVWKNGYYGEDNSINVHISNIRKKIKEIIPDEEYIKTVWGIGFKMNKI
ncbi:MAG: response regulator transcription factor [Clostridium sp.]|uniref:response regulator transcription factor n=1 Tax=Clostridium sp. TaxID=1506 RepID=UPI002A80F126|nr:response regulator transcription factor [Clostridium sp.]MCI6691723.1 response regulator transcription factor [Clostridium sp.]MDY4252543.1 response regulator transcription factor [Clostridium sp.]